MNYQEYNHRHLPEYLINSIKANPEHESAVYQFLEAVSQFQQASQRLARVAGENNDIDLDLLQDEFLTDPHLPETDQVQDTSCINPSLLHKQNEPLSADPPSNSLVDWSQWPTSGDPGHDGSNEILPSAEAIYNNISESNSLSVNQNSANLRSTEDTSNKSDNFFSTTELAGKSGHNKLRKAARTRKKGHKSGKLKRAQSTIKKSKSLPVPKTLPEPIISPQQAESPHSMMRDSGRTQMWSVSTLTTKSLRPDLASFLEVLSNLWQTGRFWNPDPLCLSVPEGLPMDKSCLGIFRYLRDLNGETQINVVRRRFAQIKLHLTFVHRCNEMGEKKRGDRKPSSHVINDLLRSEDNDQHPDNGLTSKQRSDFIRDNACGRRWYLIAHYVGWGSLIIFNNADSPISKIGLPLLEDFITYFIKSQPAIVELCREYEQPVKDLLNGKKPTLTLTEEEVRRAIDCLPHTVDVHAHWKRVNKNIHTDVFEVLQHS